MFLLLYFPDSHYHHLHRGKDTNTVTWLRIPLLSDIEMTFSDGGFSLHNWSWMNCAWRNKMIKIVVKVTDSIIARQSWVEMTICEFFSLFLETRNFSNYFSWYHSLQAARQMWKQWGCEKQADWAIDRHLRETGSSVKKLIIINYPV